MTDWTEDMHNMARSAFPRIARNLNYRRSFPTPTSARVDIPCIPYEAFDNTGTKVKPWSLLRLFESVRAFSFWEDICDDTPKQSLVDMHTVLQNHFVFIVDAKVDISPHLHHDKTPKYPLYVLTHLKSVGKSSKTIYYELRHAGSDMLYASCDISDVLIDRDSRKPISYPDWWMAKYGNACKTAMQRVMIDAEPGMNIFTSMFNIQLADTDTYKHANWAAYVKYCYENLCTYAQNGMYGNITESHLEAGLKSFGIVYQNEANAGDQLIVSSWEDTKKDHTVIFRVQHSGMPCCRSYMELYKPGTEHASDIDNVNTSKL